MAGRGDSAPRGAAAAVACSRATPILLPTRPGIPGAPLPDGLVNSVLDYDLGAGFKYNDVSGVISIQPPIVKQVIPTLVPKFAQSKAERTASGDPRLSLEERYGTHEKYVETVRAAAGDVLAAR